MKLFVQICVVRADVLLICHSKCSCPRVREASIPIYIITVLLLESSLHVGESASADSRTFNFFPLDCYKSCSCFCMLFSYISPVDNTTNNVLFLKIKRFYCYKLFFSNSANSIFNILLCAVANIPSTESCVTYWCH